MTDVITILPEEPAAESAKPDRRILWLVVGHVAIALLAAGGLLDIWCASQWRGALFVGIFFSQICLLGIWVGLSPSPIWFSAIGIVAFIGYSWLISFVGGGRGMISLVAVAVTVAAVSSLIMRLCGYSIQPTARFGSPLGRLQFSILHVLAVTSIVAILLTLAMQIRVHHPGTNPFFDLTYKITALAVLQVYLVLATNRPHVGGGIAAAGPFAIHVLVRGIGFDSQFTDRMIETGIASLVMFASLLIVRSFGYRLVARPSLHRRKTATNGLDSSITRVSD